MVPAEFQQCANDFLARFQVSPRLQEGSRTVLARSARLDQFPPFQQSASNVPAIFQPQSSKVPVVFRFPEHAFCWHHSPPQRLKPKRIAVRKLQQDSQEGYGMFQQGCRKVPARFQQDSRKVASKVPARFQEGSSMQGSRKVPARFQQSSSKVPGRFKQGSIKVPGRFQQGCLELV